MTQPINPYVAGAPLRGERGFFGRQDTLDWVARELRNPATNALVLFGQRRIGKTTLLLQLQRNLPDDAFLPVYFDLQDQATRPLGEVLADLADTVAERADLESPGPGVFDDQGRFFRRTFLRGLYDVALGESRRPVFLLDEFDVLDQTAEAELPETAAAEALFPFLRRVMTEDSRPAFVFVVGRRAEDLSLDFTATFKASLMREIWVLDRESAETLVRQAEANGTLRFTDQAVERILSLTSYHPYLTQLLCQRVWERAHTGNPSAPPRIDTPEVEAAVSDALEAGDQALVWLWNGLSPAEKIYAAALAEASDERETISEDQVIQVLTAQAARLRTREVELAPRDLVKRRVLEQVREQEYRLAVELFRRWLRQHKPLRDVKDELDRVEPVADRLYEIGRDFFNRRQWETALRYFRDALEVYLNHFRARLHLGEALLEMSQTDEAVAELGRAYELDQDEARLPLARALVAQAKARQEAGDEDGALAACEQALQISPNERVAQEMRAAIWTRRGDAALDQDDLETALAAYLEASATDKIAQVGDAALERDDLETALMTYREAGETEKIAQVEALQRRRALAALEAEAQAHEQAERWAEAAVVYERLVAQAPDEESRVAWQMALKRCQEEEELAHLFNGGLGALEQEDWKQAQRAFAEVVHRRPDYEKGGRLAASLLEQAVEGGKAAVPAVVAEEKPKPLTVPPTPREAVPKEVMGGRTLLAGGLVLLAIVGVIIVAVCGGALITPTSEEAKPVVLRGNLSGEPPTLDPALASDTTSVLCDKQLFLGLTAFDKDKANVVPELATEWSVSSDGLTWTFKMRDDVQWVNYSPETNNVNVVGPVTAYDVVYGVKRTINPETASDYAYVLYIIKGAEAANTGEGSMDDVGVRAVDDYTVEFTLESPAAYFPSIASMWVARPQPQAAIEEHGEKWTEPGNIVTNGPYLLKSWEHEASMVMVKNPVYYDNDNVQIQRIEWVMVQESSTQQAMYEKNELDAIGGGLGWGPPLEDMDRIKADPVLSKELKIVPRMCTYHYGFINTKPPFDNHLVRKAFSAAIDRQSLIDNVTRAYQVPAIHFAPPGTFGAPPADEVGIGYDPEQAKAWLAEAGYPGGEGLGEIILMHNVSEAHAQIAQAIGAMWKETLSVDVTIETQEWKVYLQTLNKNTLVEDMPHIFRLGWCADYPDENNWVHEVFNTEAGANRCRRGCVDPNCEEVQPTKFDELTRQAGMEQDPEKRKELYREAERILIEEETAIAPIYHYTDITLTKPWVTVRYDSRMGGSPIKDWRIDVEAKAETIGQ